MPLISIVAQNRMGIFVWLARRAHSTLIYLLGKIFGAKVGLTLN